MGPVIADVTRRNNDCLENWEFFAQFGIRNEELGMKDGLRPYPIPKGGTLGIIDKRRR